MQNIQLTNKDNSSIYKKIKQNNRQKSAVEHNIGSEKRYPYFLSGASAHCQTNVDNGGGGVGTALQSLL